jgi:hypothetical protein
MRRYDVKMSPKAAALTIQRSSKRRKISWFDLSIAFLWTAVVLVFSLTGLRQNAPQEIKVIMTPGLLLIIYGLALLAQWSWQKFRNKTV